MSDTPTNIITKIEQRHPEFFERERKFRLQMRDEDHIEQLVNALREKEGTKVSRITQGYVSKEAISKIRLRLVHDDSGTLTEGFITLKGPPLHDPKENDPKKRLELEIPIPADQLEAYGGMFSYLCPVSLEKQRYSFKEDNRKFDVDRYLWSEGAKTLLNADGSLGPHYNHLVTLDLELNNPADTAPLSKAKNFPEILRPYLVLPDKKQKVQEITNCCSYKSAALAALNTSPQDDAVIAALREKIASDQTKGRISAPPEASAKGR